MAAGDYKGRLKPFVPAIMKWHLDGLSVWEMKMRLWRNTGYMESTDLIRRVIKLETGRTPRKFWCRAQRARIVGFDDDIRGLWWPEQLW